MHAYNPIRIVDARKVNWVGKVREAADSKRNFIVILGRESDLEVICQELGCSPQLPERLRRWGIHALSEVLEPDGYSQLLSVYESFPVYMVEQLQLTRNHPPRCKPFLLYCEVRGIISDHSSLEDAGNSLLDYLDSFKRARIFPLAGIYRFKGKGWQRLRKLTVRK